jgi:ATP-binding cassette, subfamily B, bacterial
MKGVKAVPIAPEDDDGRYSMRQRLRLLIGDRMSLVLLLIGGSIILAIIEATFLAFLAEIVLTLGTGQKKVSAHNGHLSFIHVQAPVGTLLLIAACLCVARVIIQIPVAALPARIASDVQARLRRDLFSSYTRASWDVQAREREGHLQETMTGQVMQATGGAVQATGMISASFTFIVLLAFAFALSPVAAGIVLVATVTIFAALRPLNQLGARQARALSRAQLEYAGGVGQANRLAEETRVFGTGAAQRKEIEGLVDTARGLYFRTQMIQRLTPTVFQSAVYLIMVGGLEILYKSGTSHLASLGAVVLLLLRASTYGQSVQGSWQALRQSLPFIERLQDAREKYLSSTAKERTAHIDEVHTLSFENVSFAYNEERPVLSQVSFEVAGGESIGVVGPSGAGKSTLIQLLLRLRSPKSGRYLIDGLPVDEIFDEDWHRQIAYVPQEPRLLHATVAENIRFFRDLDDESVERAARLARIHDEIVSWPEGYETIVGPRADAVSGGQQQRICLARALVGNPQVLILDEPTSALDPHSESLIQESLTVLREHLTLFIVAHRMSTLEICDRVMVIVDGRLVGFDARAALQQTNTYYRQATELAFGGASR